MIKTQHQSEARNRTAMTALPTRLAPMNRPIGDRSEPCMPTPRFAPRRLYCASGRGFQPHANSRRRRDGSAKATRTSRGRLCPCLHSLYQQAQQGAAGRGLQLLGVDRPVVVRVGALESDFDEGEVLVLADRLVIVGVRDLPVLGGNTIFQFLPVKGAVMIDIELVEQSAGGGLRLVEVDRSILVGVKGLERRRRERGRSARYDYGQRRRDR